MDMQQIERRLLGHFSHLGCQRQRVRRMIKQRVRRDLNLVEKDPIARAGQADGHGIADEMNLMAASGEFDAQFGGHDARTAIGRVAGDPDFHGLRESEARRGLPEDTADRASCVSCARIATGINSISDASPITFTGTMR